MREIQEVIVKLFNPKPENRVGDGSYEEYYGEGTELIRCKDCEFCDEYRRCEMWDFIKTEDSGYCYMGKRKTE